MISQAPLRMLSLSKQLVYSTSSSNANVDFVDGPLPKIILNKPKVLNSLSIDMIHSLSAYLSEIKKAPAFWMEGAGGKAFCAGGDVKALFTGEDAGYEKRESFFRDQFTLDYELSALKSLQIANWDGIVMGGGIGVSLFAPFRIATEKTMLAMPEANIGFYTDVGSAYILSRLRSNIGMYIALTSGRLKGEDVYHSGFANYFIGGDKVATVYEQIASKIRQSSNPKQTIHDVISKYSLSAQKKIQNEDEINHIFGAPTVKEIYERAKASETKFAQGVVKSLENVCPLSVHINHRLIKSTPPNMSLRDVFVRDFTLAQYFSADSDFGIGVKALLVDKTNDPKWTHKHLLDVKEEEVEAAFKAVEGRTPLRI